MNSPQQQDVIDAVARGESVTSPGVAGCGKTTTGNKSEIALLEASPGTTVLNCCFAKRNQLDFEEKMPKGTVNRTFNSLGHSGIIKMLGKRVKVLSGYSGREKQYGLMNLAGIPSEDFPDLPRLISLAKNAGILPEGAPAGGHGLTPDTDEEWQEIIENSGLDLGIYELEPAIKEARAILLASLQQGLTGEIDFDDQLYIPVMYSSPFDHYDFVFVDEAQDLNPIQHHILRRITRGSSQVLVCGDPNQAIYAFRGALPKSFTLLQDEFAPKILPLTVSFRCPKSVVREANRYVPEMTAFEGNIEGRVRDLFEWSYKDFIPGDAILCRNNKPLIPIFYYLLKHGIGAKIQGSDIGKGFASIVKKLLRKAGSPDLEQAALLKLIDDWADDEWRKYTNKGQPAKAALARERGEVLHMIAERHPTAQTTIMGLDHMFSDKGGPVTLSTIHKAKGLEWPRVFFLDRELLPSRFATMPWELRQEDNLAYVGTTRAMQELAYISSRR